MGKMNRNFLSRTLKPIFGFCVLAEVIQAQVLQTYVNTGIITSYTNIPQTVVNFTNYGYVEIDIPDPETISLAPPEPFEFYELKNFVNRPGSFPNSGIMYCTPGWRFNYRSISKGTRGLASLFQVENGAAIIGGSRFLVTDDPLPCVMTPAYPSYVIARATNIVVKAGVSRPDWGVSGSLIAGANGLIELTGINVNLDTARLHILPVWQSAMGSQIIFDAENNPIAFIPDLGISDVYWESGVYSDTFPLATRGLWDGTQARTGTTRGLGFTLINPMADSYVDALDYLPVALTNIVGSPDNVSSWFVTNVVIPTNIVKGAVFVGIPPGFDVQLGFGPLSYPPLGRDIYVAISTLITNVAACTEDIAYVYIQDTLGPSTDNALLPNNYSCGVVTYRPANYLVSRVPENMGTPGNWGYPDPEFFVSSGLRLLFPDLVGIDTVTNATVTSGLYSAYEPYFDNLVYRPIVTPEVNFSNFPGRIVINATNLSLRQARLRGEGYIKIQAANLISSRATVIDCENIALDLNTTNGNVSIENLVPQEVQRLRGPILLWSAAWSNTAIVIMTNNWLISTNENVEGDVTNYVVTAVPEWITNTVGMRLHTLMVDATGLQRTFPVFVHELMGRGTNIVINDNLTVAQSLLFLGRSLTVNGMLTIPGQVPNLNEFRTTVWTGPRPLEDWVWTNAPNLLYFTNNGVVYIYNNAHFGDDGPRRYEWFYNNGTLTAMSLGVKSAIIFNGGVLNSLSYQKLDADLALLQGGRSFVGSDLTLVGKDFKLDNYTIQVGGTLELAVSNSLLDSGAPANNMITARDGFRMYVKPTYGDLLGTTFTSDAPDYWAVDVFHTWAGEDRGLNPSGYTNNAALGVLKLTSLSPYPLFEFGPAGTRNALYVDVLDISDLGADFTNKLWIDENFVIYYASAVVGFTPPNHPNGEAQLPEEYLDGQFEGRLRWVRDYAGPRSGVAVVVDGKTVYVNQALRNSHVIDSDGDGIPNYYDSTPFGGLSLIAELLPRTNYAAIKGLGSIPPGQLALKWFARTNAIYTIQYSTNLLANQWVTLKVLTNTSPTNCWLGITDDDFGFGSVCRFYRVIENRK